VSSENVRTTSQVVIIMIMIIIIIIIIIMKSSVEDRDNNNYCHYYVILRKAGRRLRNYAILLSSSLASRCSAVAKQAILATSNSSVVNSVLIMKLHMPPRLRHQYPSRRTHAAVPSLHPQIEHVVAEPQRHRQNHLHRHCRAADRYPRQTCLLQRGGWCRQELQAEGDVGPHGQSHSHETEGPVADSLSLWWNWNC
jgi:hypothetical protein